MDAHDVKDVVTRVLEPGETTSEHAVMQSATIAGRVYAILGTLVAAIPALIDLLGNSPVAGTKYGGIALAVLGAIVAIMGIAKETKAKVEYISGRSIIKAATVANIAAPPPAL